MFMLPPPFDSIILIILYLLNTILSMVLRMACAWQSVVGGEGKADASPSSHLERQFAVFITEVRHKALRRLAVRTPEIGHKALWRLAGVAFLRLWFGVAEVDMLGHDLGAVPLVALLVRPGADLQPTADNGHAALGEILGHILAHLAPD